MSALTLVGIYLVGGGLCALFWRKRVDGADLLLLLIGWPLYLPFLISAPSPLGESLRHGHTVDLGVWLPDEATARRVRGRLDAAARRVAEIELLLREPDFDLDAAMARAARLKAEGRAAAISAARTVRNIERLIALRRRYLREIEDIEELARQLRTQAEIFRLAGQAGPHDLLDALMTRVQSLDAVLEEGLIFEDLSGEPPSS
ncbi:hypothetical protein KKF91_21110 [Myxococcota bacterium]|nr:hypothetical protein [Myxococcota bacterium]MBU1433044.1 hypothetical protein [Myxococcota bacterium]MBU1899921.1 hypothetical protein [Myxococcota bacterium]